MFPCAADAHASGCSAAFARHVHPPERQEPADLQVGHGRDEDFRMAEHGQAECPDDVVELFRHEIFCVVVEERMDHGKQFDHLVCLAAAVARFLQPAVEFTLEQDEAAHFFEMRHIVGGTDEHQAQFAFEPLRRPALRCLARLHINGEQHLHVVQLRRFCQAPEDHSGDRRGTAHFRSIGAVDPSSQFQQAVEPEKCPCAEKAFVRRFPDFDLGRMASGRGKQHLPRLAPFRFQFGQDLLHCQPVHRDMVVLDPQVRFAESGMDAYENVQEPPARMPVRRYVRRLQAFRPDFLLGPVFRQRQERHAGCVHHAAEQPDGLHAFAEVGGVQIQDAPLDDPVQLPGARRIGPAVQAVVCPHEKGKEHVDLLFRQRP